MPRVSRRCACLSLARARQGGALYALGLIHANRSGGGASPTVTYLSDALRNAGNDETVQHGACLGLGLAAMATGTPAVYDELKTVLYFDMAVGGEGAALGLGLLLLGHGSGSTLSQAAIAELIAYAHDTAHEKIIRSLGLAVGLIMAGQEENAEPVIEQLARDRDPILRYGAMFTIALAYAGTSNNAATRRLLHVAVSDVSDDVRRAAVMCLGIVLFRTPSKVPKLVALLAESFNPHVRYGACMAIGFACAGTGDVESLALLEPMMADVVDFVRQGAFMASAMVLQQLSEARAPRVKAFREKLMSVIKEKHATVLTKVGAVVAAGILDAGGRNACISMQSAGGFTKLSAVAGLVIWAQHWYWFPCYHFLSLSLAPTMLLGLNKDLKMPTAFRVHCATKPSLYEYPAKTVKVEEVKKERVVTAVLSTSAASQARAKRKEALENKDNKDGAEGDDSKATSSSMDVDAEGGAAASASKDGADAKGGDAKGDAKGEDGDAKADGDAAPAEPKKPKGPEPPSFLLPNPSRVTVAQRPHIAFSGAQRYVPVHRNVRPAGAGVASSIRYVAGTRALPRLHRRHCLD